DHSRARDRGVARRVARPESARYPDDDGHRHRRALARLAEEDARLAALHRRAAAGAGMGALVARGSEARDAEEAGTRLHGHLHRRAKVRAGDVLEDTERVHEETCITIHGKRRVSDVRRKTPQARIARGDVRGYDIADISRMPIKRLAEVMRPAADGTAPHVRDLAREHAERAIVAERIAQDLVTRMDVMLDLGLGYLSLDRSTPTLSPGELQRLRLATQVRSNLFGVVYVLDEPSAGLHPADTEALLTALRQLKAGGNSLFVVEHELDVVKEADWIVDVGPAAGEHGGIVLYSGPTAGLADVKTSKTRRYLFGEHTVKPRIPRVAKGWLSLEGVRRNNIVDLDVEFPLGVLTSVTGVSGSGKSSLVSQALVELVAGALGHAAPELDDDEEALERSAAVETSGRIAGGMETIKRLVRVDQKPIGRTPRS